MKVLAPGKLVLTGAYAVLEGAPAVVAAIDRYAVADTGEPERVDTSSMRDEGGRKLGLGSSAAWRVAAEGAREAAGGADLRVVAVRARIFDAVRAAHARDQGGGSGVDVAAAVHGGVVRYVLDGARANARRAPLPQGVELAAFFSGESARTSDLRARVEALKARDRHALARLCDVALEADAAVVSGAALDFVRAARAFGAALARLGESADAPIVPPAFSELASLAARDGGAFLPSGAGGGDVGVWLSLAPPPVSFVARARSLAMRPLSLCIDPDGVRVDSTSR